MNLVAGFLELGTGQTVGTHVQKKEVVLGAVRHQGVPTLHELVCQGLGIRFYLFAIFLEFWGSNLFKLSGKCGNLVIVGAALKHGEYSKIELIHYAVLFAAEDHA